MKDPLAYVNSIKEILNETDNNETDNSVPTSYGFDFMAKKSVGPKSGNTIGELKDAVIEKLVPDIGISYNSPSGFSMGVGPTIGKGKKSINFGFRKEFDDGGIATPKRGFVDEPGSYAGKEFTDQQLIDLGFSKGSNLQPQKETYKKLAEIFQQADIDDELEYLLEKSKNNPKGKIQSTLRNVLNKLPEDEKGLKYIANLLGEDVEFVLDKIDDKKILAASGRDEKRLAKNLEKGERLRKDFGKVEKWMLNNASKYSDPDKFKKATVNRFGKKNAAIKAMTSGGGNFFSTEFNNDILGYKGTADFAKINKNIGDNIFRTTIYNFNPNVRKAITNEFKSILSGGPAEVQAEARKKIKQSKLFKKFGLTKEIRGPISRLIYKEVGEELYKNLQTFRNPRVGTTDLIRYLEGVVDPKYKGQFKQARIAMEAAGKNEFKKAKEILGISDKIMYDHKIPSSFIKAGYADEIEYIKTTPTTENFNVKIKNKQYDVPVKKLLNKFEKASTPEAKQVIYNQILEKHNNFSKKYGGYLDNVKPSFTDGKIKFSSDASPVSKKTDFVKDFTEAGIQTGELDKKKVKQLNQVLLNFCPRAGKSTGASVTKCTPQEAANNMKKKLVELKQGKLPIDEANKVSVNLNKVAKVGARVGKSSTLATLGPLGVGGDFFIEGMIVANDYLGGMPGKEAWYRNWMSIPFGGGTDKADAMEMERIAGTEPAANRYKKAMESYNKLIKLYDRESEVDEGQLDQFDLTSPGAYNIEDALKAEDDVMDQTRSIIKQREKGEDIFNILKQGSPEQQAFERRAEVENAKRFQIGLDRDPFARGVIERRSNISPALTKSYAGGGLAKLAGERFGKPPEAGPTPQGLAYILKRDR